MSELGAPTVPDTAEDTIQAQQTHRTEEGRGWGGKGVNPFTTENPFLGTKLLGFSIGRGSGAPKGLKSFQSRLDELPRNPCKTCFFSLLFILRRMGKNKALAHHTSTYAWHDREYGVVILACDPGL